MKQKQLRHIMVGFLLAFRWWGNSLIEMMNNKDFEALAKLLVGSAKGVLSETLKKFKV